MRVIENIGKKYGRYTILKNIGDGRGHYLCRCDCGTEKIVNLYQLKSGAVKSCGCLKKEIQKEKFSGNLRPKGNIFQVTHGMTGTQIYKLWAGMLNSVRNQSSYRYKYIGGIGIKYTESWENFELFFNDIKDLYEKAKKRIKGKIYLCRKDIAKDFTKDNIFFGTKQESSQQYRKYVIWDGEKYTQTDLIRKIGMSYENAKRIVEEKRTKQQYEDYKFNSIDRFNYKGKLLTAKEIVQKEGVNINHKVVHDRLKYRGCNIEEALTTSWLGNTSLYEKEMLSFISKKYKGKIVSNYRVYYGNGKFHEIDIYIPELNLGIEYNGCYYHSTREKKENNCHLNKKLFFNDRGINVITIWEDERINKKDIVKSMILNKLGKSQKIYARKTNIVLISQKQFDDFCDQNHIQGHGPKLSFLIGLEYNGKIVSVMGFSSKKNTLERFCSLCGYNVVGGFSKMLKYYIVKNNPKEIISFAAWDVVDINNNIYIKNGFTPLDYNANYFYINQVGHYKYERYHKSNFRKDKIMKKFNYKFKKGETEFQAMDKLGFLRCYNSGIQKYVLFLDVGKSE